MRRHMLSFSALAAGAALAWTALAWQPEPPAVPPLSDADAQQAALVQSGPLPAVSVEPAMALMAERPLFSPSRRPPDAEPEVAIADAGPSDVPKVQGVALSGGIAIVIVSDQDGRPKRVQRGDQVAGWKVETISHDLVSFGSDGAMVDVPVVIRKE